MRGSPALGKPRDFDVCQLPSKRLADWATRLADLAYVCTMRRVSGWPARRAVPPRKTAAVRQIVGKTQQKATGRHLGAPRCPVGPHDDRRFAAVVLEHNPVRAASQRRSAPRSAGILPMRLGEVSGAVFLGRSLG
jgi:hypothetical protein